MISSNYSTRCKNRNPRYARLSHRKPPPFFIKKISNRADNLDISSSNLTALNKAWGFRKKRYYQDRNDAIRALFQVFSDHLNLITWQVEISLSNAADLCGLSTVSASGHKSISRASRAFSDMIELGVIVAPLDCQQYDSESQCWTDKYFEVTPLFFFVLGIKEEEAENQRAQMLGYAKTKALKAGFSAEEVGRMSISQIKNEKKLHWRRASLARIKEKRSAKISAKKQDQELNKIAQERVLRAVDVNEITHTEFATLVQKEIAYLRKLAYLTQT